MTLDSNIYKKISDKLFEDFFVDDHKYGQQQHDGSYKLIKGKITPVTIDDMLLNQKSLLTYQELHVLNHALIKWICLDLDIEKREIDKNSINQDNLRFVKESTDEVCLFLESKKIPYLLEFSGRRGFHIWIIFEKLVSKEDGFKLIEYIHENTVLKFRKSIVADKFPKTPNVSANSKGIGFGVKLPLSQNKRSGKLSFFLNRNDSFDFDDSSWLSKPTNEFLQNQYELLNSYNPVSIELIKPFVNEFETLNAYSKHNNRYIFSKEVKLLLPEHLKLEEALTSIRKCEHIDKILKDFEKGLGGKERSILVGLLIHLKYDYDEEFGRNLLMKLFSQIQGFDEKKTRVNLENLSYYQPITCKSLGKCSTCEECKLDSPIQLIKGVTLSEKSKFSIRNINAILFERIKASLDNYSFRNDEVPLFPLIEKIKNIGLEEIAEIIDEIYNNNISCNDETYKFLRNEKNKIRELYNISASDNVISVYFALLLNRILYSQISNNSYGYEFIPSFYNGNIFQNWFVNWIKYTKNIENILFNNEYQDYYLIKIDIKGYYDNIDLDRLKIKLDEELPAEIKENISSFSDEDKRKYKNIVQYLINLSKVTTGNKKGVPQGPAYARYLAELYLTGLDKLVETYILKNQSREFYNRFVDDIFIFIESQERADKLYESISEWMLINGLEFNIEKTKVVRVDEYVSSGEYTRYRDDAKYDINYVNKNKNILSDDEVNKALLKLDKLTSDVKFGLKDHLRFFYYQFKDDTRLNYIRKRLLNLLPFQNDGRGTLYLLFYNDLFKNFNEDFWKLVERIHEIRGLSLTHFLNTILLNYQSDLIDEDAILKLVNSVYNSDRLSKADMVLIATLILKYKLDVQHDIPKEIMNYAIEIPGIKYSLESWKPIEQKLSVLDKISFLKELERIIRENEFSIDFLNQISAYSFNRFIQWDLEEDKAGFIESESSLLLYYHCLCFLTLFEASEHNNVKTAWKLLINKSEKMKVNDSSYDFYWINKLQELQFNDFSNESYNFILSDKIGSELYSRKCQNNFLDQYKNVLVLFLFAKDQINGFKDYKNNISEYIENKSLFYKWVDDPDVKLYPQNEGICLKNIALNGLITLISKNKIFVKSISNELQYKKYDYIDILDSYENNEIEYNIPGSTISAELKHDNIIDVVVELSSLIKKHEEFKTKYDTKTPYFYIPSYSVGSLPLIPFYSDYNKVISNIGIPQESSIEGYYQNILYILSNLENIENLSLVKDDIKYNFKMEELENRFIPNSNILIDGADDKIDFIKEFASETGEKKISDVFQFQYFWTKTICQMLKKGARKSSANKLVSYFNIHSTTFHKDLAHIDIFFAINNSLIPTDKNLKEFYDTIKNSLEIFNTNIELADFNFISDVWNEYEPKFVFENKDIDNITMDLELFIKSKVEIKTNRDWTNGRDVLVLIVNDVKIEDSTNVCLYDNNINQFTLVQYQDMKVKSNYEYLFAFQIKDYLFIYSPEIELVFAYNRVITRYEIYKDSLSENNSEILKHFPQNPNYDLAEKSYTNFADILDVKRKLAVHYFHNINIKERIINWLSIFNNESIDGSELFRYMQSKNLSIDTLHHTLLTIINHHFSITEKDITFFKNKLEEYENSEEAIVFAVKNPNDDLNGLSRLLQKCGFNDRQINFKKNTKLLFKNLDDKITTIVIPSDVVLSGSQIKKALSYYYHEFSDDDGFSEASNSAHEAWGNKKPDDERYYIFRDYQESENFRNNLKKFDRIVFLSPIITNDFKENITKLCKDEFGLKNEILFVSNGASINRDKYIYEDIIVHPTYYNLFSELIQDVDLIEKLFLLPTRKTYKDSVKKINERNLMFRIGSLPTKHFYIFSLPPRKGRALLEYVSNWK